MKYLWIHKEKEGIFAFFSWSIHILIWPSVHADPLGNSTATPTKGWYFLFSYQCCHQPASRWKTGGTSMVVQWLRLCASKAGGIGSIPDWGRSHTIPYAAWCSQKIKNEKKKLKKERKKREKLARRVEGPGALNHNTTNCFLWEFIMVIYSLNIHSNY